MRALLVAVLLAAGVGAAKPGGGGGGFLADLSAVAEGNTHHGYDSGKEAAELWRLGDPSAAGAALSAGRTLQQLQGEARHAEVQTADARSAQDKTEREGSAISLALNRKLAVLPENSECTCAHKNGWAVVTAARAQVLKEEGYSGGGDVKKQADECPCRSALVGAVTEVLQDKLEKLTEELGSSTSAALALQRALVSMRLPDALAGELTKELDQSLAKKAKKKAGVEKTKEEADPGSEGKEIKTEEGKAEKEPEAINVIVNNNLGDGGYNVTTSEIVNQSLPYFYGYKYPAAYIQGGQAPFNAPRPYPWESGKESPMNLIVNVNNYILPKEGCYTTRCFRMRADKAQLRALKTKRAARHLERSAVSTTAATAAAGSRPDGHESAQQQVLEKKLSSAVDALQKIGLESKAEDQRARPRKAAGSQSQGALEQERQRLVQTARALEDVARRKAAAIRESGARRDGAKARSVSTKAKMTQLFQMVAGAGGAVARSGKGVSEADVLSHVDEWEEAQRHEMHDEDGFQLLSPEHGDMAAAAGRGYAGAQENEFVGGRFNAVASRRVPDISHFDIHSMLGHRGGVEEESDKAARSDLMGYYHSLQQHVKKKPLKHAGPNPRVGDAEVRQ
jgi:hypothetical protein